MFSFVIFGTACACRATSVLPVSLFCPYTSCSFCLASPIPTQILLCYFSFSPFGNFLTAAQSSAVANYRTFNTLRLRFLICFAYIRCYTLTSKPARAVFSEPYFFYKTSSTFTPSLALYHRSVYYLFHTI